MDSKNQLDDTKQAAKTLSGKHSARVARLKVILPVAVGLGLATLALWPLVQAHFDHLRDKVTARPPVDVNIKNKLINPESVTLDEKGRPVKVRAETAEQQGDDKVDLQKPTNEIELDDGVKVKIKAERGAIDRKTDTLTYEGDVQLETSSGYHLQTPSASLNLKSHVAEGNEPVTAKGPAGEVQGEGFTVDRENKRLTIKGKSRLVINPKQKQQKPDENK